MEPSGFNETPEGKPWCGMTYLAGEEEALAKRKGKTLYTHKSRGCGLGGWLSLINRQGTRERQSWRRVPRTGEQHVETEEELSKQGWVSNLSCDSDFFLFFFHCVWFYFNLSHHHPSAKAPSTKERRATGRTQQRQEENEKTKSKNKNQGNFLYTD